MSNNVISNLLNEIPELIYVADTETYELLFLNQPGKELFGVKELNGEKCYALLQGLDKPCSFCTNTKLNENDFYTWEFTNRITNKHFLLKDRLVNWFNRKARIEIAFDTTEIESHKIDLHNALLSENLINESAKKLYAASSIDIKPALNEVLADLGNFLNSDRVYIFDIINDKMYNTYEWCAPGVSPQMENLQNLDLELISAWKEDFYNQRPHIVANIEDIKGLNYESYLVLKEQAIHSLITAPLFINDKLSGYIGIDNYDTQKFKHSTSVLSSIAYFISALFRHQHTMDILHKLSYQDILTNVQNRNAFMRTLKELSTQKPQSVGILYVDINGMKQINDLYGHQGGDMALIETAKKISRIFADEFIYRIGGDEFIVVIPQITALEFKNKTQEIKQLFTDKDLCSVAIGSSWSEACRDINLLLSRADEQMYADKKIFYYGQAQSNRCRPKTDDVLGLSQENTLLEAINAKKFSLIYQPRFAVKSNKLVALEALARYNTNENLVLPDQFTPVLEANNLIPILDLHLFEQLCQQMSIWQEQGKTLIPVAINISHCSLSQASFPALLQEILDKYHLNPQLFEIEIKKTLSIHNFDLFKNSLQYLRNLGCKITINYFGVPDANLLLFTTLDFDYLKLHRSLIAALDTNPQMLAILECISALCNKFNIKLIAEGTENPDNIFLLQNLGCYALQSYLFSEPLDDQEITNKYL